ncbi:hypothetical protein ACO1MN_16250, partial [Staphylococcus aureus]
MQKTEHGMYKGQTVANMFLKKWIKNMGRSPNPSEVQKALSALADKPDSDWRSIWEDMHDP